MWNGNAQYIGSSVDIKNLSFNANQYNEYALGIARAKDGGKFKYGIRVKLLQGLYNFNTKSSEGTIAVDPRYYAQTLTGNISAQSSSVYPTTQGNILKTLTNFNNLGVGLDLGASYMPSKKWEITGAVNNLGAIFWQSNTKSYTVNGTYQFQGMQLNNLIQHTNNGNINLSSYGDSLKTHLGVKGQSSSRYKTYLSPSVYLSTSYSLGRNTKIALTGYTDFYKGMRPAGSFAFIQRAGRILNFVISYNVRKNSYNNMGLGLMFKIGPVQYYLAGDNVLVLNPFNTNNFNLRTGMNLVFGKTRKPEMLTHKEE